MSLTGLLFYVTNWATFYVTHWATFYVTHWANQLEPLFFMSFKGYYIRTITIDAILNFSILILAIGEEP